MTNDYSEMSDEELAALRQQIDRELASRTKKPVKPTPPTQPPVKTPKVPVRSFGGMSAKFCRKCGHPIWGTRSSASLGSHSTPLFYVKGRGDKPKQVTHCPGCDRKLSPGRLKYDDETEAAIRDALKRPDDPPKPNSTMWSEYCVECGYNIGVITSTPPQFYDEGDRKKPVNTCPNCHAPLKEADDVEFSELQKDRLWLAYSILIRAAEEHSALQPEFTHLLERMRNNRPESLAEVKGIIGIYLSGYNTDKAALKECLAKCRQYCQANGIEVANEFHYNYNPSHKEFKIANLLQEQIGVIVATRGWATGDSLREGVAFVRELERAGIHLEIIDTEDEDKPGSRE
ncbi:MAG: hypothetical protein FOGNACKC_01956 [Anaerolineae bacterium]|nr:hypothetical protein [Anaerolineae bacterium]